MQKILVIDDDRDMCLLLKRFLSKHGFEIEDANTAKKAIELLETTEYDLILCDFRLDNMDGKTMLVKIKEKYPHMPVIIITGYSDIKIAVEVMKLGAFDYITKPLFPDEIILTIRKALEKSDTKNVPLTTSAPVMSNNGDDKKEKKNGTGHITISGQYIFGDSMAFRQILQQIELVGPTNYSVIIYGESGSGKEAIAQEIHKRSKRSHKPFVAIDCGALSKELAGSELFGHEKGAFTGALNQKTGSFELANGGTIFLDEIANLSYDIQVSLLRVVQERRMRRVGGIKDIDLDVRIIIASNEPLWEASKRGKFREDLFHRFNEFSMTIPPLRERKDDIMIFARHFLNLTNDELNKKVKGFSPEVEEIFQKYIWYGNLRELKNVVKRATLLTDGDYIEDRSLPFEIVNFNKLSFDASSEPAAPAAAPASPVPATSNSHVTPAHGRTVLDETTLKAASIDAEYEMIIEALKQANFNKSKAAKLLNIDRKTLYNKMKQYQEIQQPLVLMEKSVDNNVPANSGRTEPDLYDYKQMVLEKEKFQKILENKVRELDRSNKELEEFAYIASHDLQEPLRKITSFSERLKEKLPSNLEPDVQLYLNRMLAATDNMRTLIDNLLEFSRISRISEPFVKTDLNNIISEVRADLELKIEETSTNIKSEILPVVDAIPMQMRQLFTNLFTNAIKFKKEDSTPQIDIKCSILSDEEKEATHLRQDKYYKITVKDYGIGFDQEFSMKIFQIFQRLHGKAEYPGSGIGLAICKKIVENHSGRIFAESELGKGAEFITILPESQL